MKTSISILLFLICSFTLFAQVVQTVNRTVCLTEVGTSGWTVGDGSTIELCKDETIDFFITSTITNQFGCSGSYYFMNATEECEVCTNVSEPSLNISYTGGTYSTPILNYTIGTSNPPNTTCPNNGNISLNLTPSQNGTLSINWSNTEVYIDCITNDVTITNYNYSGTFNIDVIEMPIPILSVNNPTPSPNQNIEFTVDGCQQDTRIYLVEDCVEYNINDPSATLNPYGGCVGNNPKTITIQTPPYTVELKYKAIFEKLDCDYVNTLSNEVVINVVETPVPNACSNNNIISATETLLNDPTALQRIDYHSYPVENIVCSVSPTCTVEDVWNFLKTNKEYQVPKVEDLEIFENLFFPFPLQSTTTTTPITDCMEVEVGATSLRSLAYTFGSWIFPINETDPVKVVIDENCKCITNYTLPGHILHPGKVRRCIELDDCDKIKIVTTGTGFTSLGNNPIGEAIKRFNEIIGVIGFSKVDTRFINEY